VFHLLLLCLLIAGEGKDMPDFDSGSPIVPVFHPSEVEDAPRARNEYADAPYSAATTPNPQPTAAGAIENSEKFRNAAKQAVGLARADENRRKHGANAGGEAGFEIGRDGSTGKVNFAADQESTRGSMNQSVSPNTLGIFHTHDSFHQGDPSGADVAAAKKAKTTVYVTSRDGLYAVDPSGAKTKVSSDPNWFEGKKK
jgi:hypothetical protein